MREFDTTDVVSIKGYDDLYYVTGVIHDDGRLFITGADGKEIEVKFSDVFEHYVLKEEE